MTAVAVVNAQTITADAQAFEAYASSAIDAIGARARAWLSVQDTAAQLGVLPEALIGAELVRKHRAADPLAGKVGRAILELEAGRSELVPVRIGTASPVHLAVRRVGGGELGYFALLLRVVTVASAAVLAGGSWQLGNAWLDTRKAEAEANTLRAQTESMLAQQAAAATDPKVKGALLEALGRSSAAATDGGDDWVDKLLRGLGAGAAVAGGTGLVVLALLWLWSRRGQARELVRRRAAA